METNNGIQIDLFNDASPVILDAEKSRANGEAGLAQAEASADAKMPRWVDIAYCRFKDWLKLKPVGFLFMIEEARADILKFMPAPPSHRVFGGIPLKAKRDGLIEFAGTQQVKNVKAHRANAARWRKL